MSDTVRYVLVFGPPILVFSYGVLLELLKDENDPTTSDDIFWIFVATAFYPFVIIHKLFDVFAFLTSKLINKLRGLR